MVGHVWMAESTEVVSHSAIIYLIIDEWLLNSI